MGIFIQWSQLRLNEENLIWFRILAATRCRRQCKWLACAIVPFLKLYSHYNIKSVWRLLFIKRLVFFRKDLSMPFAVRPTLWKRDHVCCRPVNRPHGKRRMVAASIVKEGIAAAGGHVAADELKISGIV